MALEWPTREAKLFPSIFDLAVLPARLAVEPLGWFGSLKADSSKPSVGSEIVGTWNTLPLRTRGALLQSRRDAMPACALAQNSQSNYCGFKTFVWGERP